MHYKNGREAKVGDQIVGRDCGHALTGIVVRTLPGSETCNLGIAPTPSPQTYVNASDCLHLEDALQALANNVVDEAVKAIKAMD